MQAALHGVLPVHKGQFETLQQNAMRWDNRLRQAMAVCNGLVLINKTVVGMDLERNMFKAVEARFLVGSVPGQVLQQEGCQPFWLMNGLA